MAEKWAVGSGNWFSLSTWNGGTLPKPGDDVYANNCNIIIDIDITVNSLRTTAGTVARSGGVFITSGSRIINANVYAGGYTVYGASVILAADSLSVLNGNVYGSDTNNNISGLAAARSCTHNGNSYAGSKSVAYGLYCTNGTQNGDSYASLLSVGSYLTANSIQNGDSYGSGYYGTSLVNGCVQNGNAYGGSGTNGCGTYMVANSYFCGSATAGTGSAAHGVDVYGECYVFVEIAEGISGPAYGVKATYSSGDVVIIKESVGAYAHLLGSNIRTDPNLVPMMSFLSVPNTNNNSPFLSRALGGR